MPGHFAGADVAADPPVRLNSACRKMWDSCLARRYLGNMLMFGSHCVNICRFCCSRLMHCSIHKLADFPRGPRMLHLAAGFCQSPLGGKRQYPSGFPAPCAGSRALRKFVEVNIGSIESALDCQATGGTWLNSLWRERLHRSSRFRLPLSHLGCLFFCPFSIEMGGP